MVTRPFCWLLSLLCLLVVPSCTRDTQRRELRAEDSRPNIVLVTLCSFRRNRLGLEGYERRLTPFLDSLAEGGVYFENVVAASSWTKPTTASLLTGVTPGVHRMTDYAQVEGVDESASTVRVLPDAFETLPEVLSAGGYRTLCRVNNPHAGRAFGMLQGCSDTGPQDDRRTHEMIDDVAAWLDDGDPARPFFVFLMTLHVHAPYEPTFESYARLTRWDGPPVSRSTFGEHRQDVFDTVWNTARVRGESVSSSLQQEWIDLYDATVADLDAALRSLVDVLDDAGERDRTVILVTADHGEAFWENGMIEHGVQLSEALIGVPLIVSGPGIPAGRRVADVVRTIDVYPTLAGWAGVDSPAIVQGESLQPYLGADEEVRPRTAYARLGSHASVRSGSHKLVVRPAGWSLYDLEADPTESRDLYAEATVERSFLRRELVSWRVEERRRAALVATTSRELPDDARERLRALGYLGGP